MFARLQPPFLFTPFSAAADLHDIFCLPKLMMKMDKTEFTGLHFWDGVQAEERKTSPARVLDIQPPDSPSFSAPEQNPSGRQRDETRAK